MFSLYLAPTYFCQNNCLVCPIGSKKRGYSSLDLTFLIDKIEKTLSRFDSKYNIKVEISGGEPFLYRNIKNLLKYLCCKDEVDSVNVLSNLEILCNDRYYDRISESFCKAKNLFVTTLYSHVGDIHDIVSRRKKAFIRKVSAIHRLLEGGYDVHIKTLITKFNYNKLVSLFEYILREFYDMYGSNVSFSIHGLDISGNAYTYKELVAIQYKNAVQFIEKLLDYKEDIGADINVSLYTVPLCLFDPYYWKYVSFSEVQTEYVLYMDPNVDNNSSNISLSNVYSDKCKKCFLKNVCPKPWDSYISVFGDEELVPYVSDIYG